MSLTLTGLFQDIADTIRTYTGSKKTITASDFPMAIDEMAEKVYGNIAFDSSMLWADYIIGDLRNGQSYTYITKVSGLEFPTGCSGAFASATKLEGAYKLETKNATDFSTMFAECTKLMEVDIFDTSDASDMRDMFYGCTNLTDVSIDNILQMCINATSYNGTKTLAWLGITNQYLLQYAQASDYYQDFLDAGWTI